MNRTLVLCTAFLFAAAPAAQERPGTIRIGTWNIENLGQRKPPRTEESLRKIAAFILKNRVEILAVQEINGGKPLMQLCMKLGSTWRFVVGKSGGFRNQPTRIAPGFLWDSRRVRLLSASELTHLPQKAMVETGGRKRETSIFHRIPVTTVFRVNDKDGNSVLDFRAVAVHLKASTRRRDNETDADFAQRNGRNVAKRCAEVKELRSYIQRLQLTGGEDQDILVTGDFNHTYGAPAHKAFVMDSLVSYLKTADDPATIVYFPQPIDHFALAKGLSDELVVRSRAVHAAYKLQDGDNAATNMKKWKAEYSDHMLVTFDLDLSKDRDPDAKFSRSKVQLEVGSASRNPDTLAKKLTTAKAFVAGAKVNVISTDRLWPNATLLEPLGDWVVFRTADGKRVAVPRERIHNITKAN